MARVSDDAKNWIRACREEGKLLAQRESLLTLIEMRFADPVPDSVRHAIESTTDFAKLALWHQLGLDGLHDPRTFADLRNAMALDS